MRSYPVVTVWLLALVVAWLLYAQGLPGSFIFDDAPNLGPLNAIEEGSLSEMAAFSLRGISGPSGRPLSLLSFALQHESWPSAPENFKRVNILIHLANASLVLWLLLEVQAARGAKGTARNLLPVVAATIWLLWPIHVSSVLYVVQRMTLLSAGCVLFSLAIYVRASMIAMQGSNMQIAHMLFTASLGVGIGLGVLCKENAIVYPLLVLALRATLLSHFPPQPRAWGVALWLPIVAVVIYLTLSDGAFAGYQVRDFNALERLLTQARVLWMYLFQIIAPSASSLHFLYDNYLISRSLLMPWTTATALLSLIATTTGAWRIRRRYPTLAFAVLFFLGSHALESTILPLELVFEHRNYVGSLAVAYALVTGGWHWIVTARGGNGAHLARVLGGAYLAVICATTLNLTKLWSNPLQQMQLWVLHNEDSPRAHMNLAGQLLIEGYAELGAQTFESGAARFPDDMSFPIARTELACYYPELRPESLQPVMHSLKSGRQGMLPATIYLDRIVVAMADGECGTYTPSEAFALVAAAQTNPVFVNRAQDLVVLEGSLHSYAGDTAAAREALTEAIAMNPNPRLLVQAATWEIGNGNLPAARGHLETLHALQKSAPLKYLAIRDDLEKLQELLATADSPPKRQ